MSRLKAFDLEFACEGLKARVWGQRDGHMGDLLSIPLYFCIFLKNLYDLKS